METFSLATYAAVNEVSPSLLCMQSIYGDNQWGGADILRSNP